MKAFSCICTSGLLKSTGGVESVNVYKLQAFALVNDHLIKIAIIQSSTLRVSVYFSILEVRRLNL